jgi:hypothetical protein
MCEIVRLKVLPGYRLEVEFEDGLQGIVDLSRDLWGPAYEPLKDPARFAEVFLEDGAPTWPNGADMAPDAIYEDLTKGRLAAR